ncbi:uncharacterized protein G2W53_032073 [Senna tora]|uniref:DUF4378 domain-containing protein n=1 Tax=Senna tora TaxID=362788 RepID=A0A834SZU1_9FABA|nr:uncharacterized protein G2W53_032073 [Senna tora]
MEASKAVSAKQLKEHLEHQQEPFSLHNYLSERRYTSSSTSVDSKHKTRRHTSMFLHASRILRSLLYKFIPLAASDHHYTNKNDVAEAKVLPYQHQSPRIVMNMLHTSTLHKFRTIEVDAGSKPHWISTIEKQQQHYTDLKWREPLPKSECAVTAISTLSQKSARDPMFSTYLRKLLVNSNILKLRRAKKDKLHHIASLCRTNKRVLHKRKQILFGCVENARKFQENQGNSNTGEQFWFLEKQYREVRRITHLLHTESCAISEEWRNFQRLNGGIEMEIGDAIMDDIVKEMLDIFLD